MSKILIASASVFVLALGIAGVQAHQSGWGMMNGNQGYAGQGYMGQGYMGQGMMNGQNWGPGMMGYGMMGSHMMNPDMMLIMMDADSDGTLSLEEFQAMPTRMFAYLDTNKDGKVDADEIKAFHADADDTAN